MRKLLFGALPFLLIFVLIFILRKQSFEELQQEAVKNSMNYENLTEDKRVSKFISYLEDKMIQKSDTSLIYDYLFTNKTLDFIFKNFKKAKVLGLCWRKKKNFLYTLARLNKPEINKLLVSYYYANKHFPDISSMLEAASSSMQEDREKNYNLKLMKFKTEVFAHPKRKDEYILLLYDSELSSPEDLIRFAEREVNSSKYSLPVGDFHSMPEFFSVPIFSPSCQR